MLAVLAIVIWAAIALLLAPRFVRISIGENEKGNIFVKWLVLFLLPIIIILVLSFAGIVVVASMSIVGLILVLLLLIIIVAYFTVGISINGKKYKFYG
ncbi:MAG: hypothetical protein K0R09_2934 [Clostridiales bacterium]|jgi:hypothetical protein|nr:hypothetical protein [Clostridiales bacterium]